MKVVECALLCRKKYDFISFHFRGAKDDQPGPIAFSVVTNKFDIAIQTLREPPAIQKTPVNTNQGNNTTENILEASLRLSTHCKYNNYIKQWTSYSKNIGHIK